MLIPVLSPALLALPLNELLREAKGISVVRRACAVDWSCSAALVPEAASGGGGDADAAAADAPADATDAPIPSDGGLLPAAAEKRLLFKQRVFIGSCPDLDHLVHWLNSGAAQVVYTGEAEAAQDAATSSPVAAPAIEHITTALGAACPARRISLRADLATLTATAAAVAERLPGLGVEVHVASAAALANPPVHQALCAAAKVLGEFRLTVRLVAPAQPNGGDGGNDGDSGGGGGGDALPEVVAALHRAKVDVKVGGFADAAAAKALAAACFVACARTDRPDGLYSTVVADENGVALGLVYSSGASITAAVESGRGVYYSRSRGGLWRKGDTSGAWQDLQCVDLDCDNDALMFSVVQRGEPPAFCHTGTRTCWGAASGLAELELTLRGRKASAPEGSYTKRLFDDPVLLRRKLLEEANELAEAEEPDHVAAEAADVLYFALTRCVAAGVGLREIGEHLDHRSTKVKRRTGNAKSAEQRKKWGDNS